MNGDNKNIDPTESAEQKSKPNSQVEPEDVEEIKEEDMEVHHHAHHAHGKKTWKAYFWEFLMLFLAVFCGFLAEYQLEHKVEKDRERQFIISMYADLQDDIGNLEAMKSHEQQGILMLDTLMTLLNDNTAARKQGDQLYYVARVGPRSNPFANNSRTFDQLRHSGGFRLIRNLQTSNRIMGYYDEFSPIRLLEVNYNMEFDHYRRVGARIFDPAILRRQETGMGEIMRSVDNPQLRTYEPDLLKELGFHVLQMNGSRRSRLVMLENLRRTALGLMGFLKETYHLK